jgi:hypothetical protein
MIIGESKSENYVQRQQQKQTLRKTTQTEKKLTVSAPTVKSKRGTTWIHYSAFIES